jgi:hypothetical protein
MAPSSPEMSVISASRKGSIGRSIAIDSSLIISGLERTYSKVSLIGVFNKAAALPG